MSSMMKFLFGLALAILFVANIVGTVAAVRFFDSWTTLGLWWGALAVLSIVSVYTSFKMNVIQAVILCLGALLNMWVWVGVYGVSGFVAFSIVLCCAAWMTVLAKRDPMALARLFMV